MTPKTTPLTPASRAKLGGRPRLPSPHSRDWPASGPAVPVAEAAAGRPAAETGNRAGASPKRAGGLLVVGHWTLLLFLFLLFSRVCDMYLVSLHLPLIASSAAQILAVLSGGLLLGLRHRVSILLLAYSAWLTLSIPMAYWRGGAFDVVTNDWYKAFLAYLLVVTLVRSYDQAVRAVRVVAFALAVLGLLARTVGIRIDGRLLLPQGYFSNPNELGMALLAGTGLWWFLSHNPKIAMPIRILAGLILVPLLSMSLETGSRAVLLVIGLVLPMVFFEYSSIGRVKFLIAGAMLGVFLVVLLPSGLLQRFGTYFTWSDSIEDQVQQEETIGSSYQRVYLLKSSLAMTLRNPIFGVGPGNFAAVDAELVKEKGIHPGLAGTHNTYTQVSSEAGIPALLFFLGALVGCWRSLTRARRLNAAGAHPKKQEIDVLCAGLKLTLAVFLIQFWFIHMAYSAIFPAFAGLIVAVTRAVETEVRGTMPAPQRAGV